MKKPQTFRDMYNRSKRMDSISLTLGVVGILSFNDGAWFLGVPLLIAGLTLLIKSVKYDVTVESALEYMDKEILSKKGKTAIEIYESAKKTRKELKRGGRSNE